VVTELIAEHRAAPAATQDLLSLLLAARDETGAAMSESELHDEVLTFLIAGVETTSAALAWTVLLLSRNGAAALRVRGEQRAQCGMRAPSLAELPRMPYVRMVIEEALRLYPPAYGLTRRVLADDDLGGFLIPKDAQVLVSPYAMHRHPDFWHEPDRFDPERFAPERAQGRPRFAHIPFGGGPRQCIGNAFAMLELQVVIPTLIGAFDFALAEGADATPDPRMTLRPRGPLWMQVTPAAS
jgi:cytochrome P450